MKKLLLILALFTANVVAFTQTGGALFFDAVRSSVQTAEESSVLPDGWYVAKIYYTSNTGQRSEYVLNVGVEDLNVTIIDFGNGGYVHRGRNNEGYTYRGGALHLLRNSYGQVYAAETDVYIDKPNGGWQKFHIWIE